MREGFLDRLRVAATCAVVLLHTVTGILYSVDIGYYPLEKRIFLTVQDLVCWCVPVFLLISGYLFLNPVRELSFKKMLTKYCRRVAAALLLFGVPYAWVELAAKERALQTDMLWRGLQMVLRGESWAHLWYLYLILVLYLLTPAIKWVLGKVPRAALYAALAVLLLWSSMLPFLKRLYGLETLWVLPDEGIYFFYYLCGYLFVVRGCGKAKRRSAFCGVSRTEAVSAAGILILTAGMIYSRGCENYSVLMAYNYPPTVVLSLLLFSGALGRQRRTEEAAVADGTVAKEAVTMGIATEGAVTKEAEEAVATKKKRNDSLWAGAGALCFAVYLIHPVFLNIYYKLLKITPMDFCVWVSLPLFFAATLIPSFVGAWLLYKLPVLRKWVL